MKMCSYEPDEVVVVALAAAAGGSQSPAGKKAEMRLKERDMKWYQVAQETVQASFWLIGNV